MGGTSSSDLIEKAWYLCYFAPLPVAALKETLEQLQKSFDHKTLDRTLKDPRLRDKKTSNFSLFHLACNCSAAPQLNFRADDYDNYHNFDFPDRHQFFVNKREIIQFLLETGAFDINAQDNTFGEAPLHAACMNASPHTQYSLNSFYSNMNEVREECLRKNEKLLLMQQQNHSSNNNNTNKNQQQSRSINANEEYRKILIYLIVEGAKIDSVATDTSSTPLNTACGFLNTIAVNELVGAGAKISYYKGILEGDGCVHTAIFARRRIRNSTACVAVLQTLTTVATAFDKITSSRRPPLCVAFENKFVPETYFLLDNGYSFYTDFDRNIQEALEEMGRYGKKIPSSMEPLIDLFRYPAGAPHVGMPVSAHLSLRQIDEIAKANSLAAAIVLGHFPLFRYLVDSWGRGSLFTGIGKRSVTPLHLLLSADPGSEYDQIFSIPCVKYIFGEPYDAHGNSDRKFSDEKNKNSESYQKFIQSWSSTMMEEEDGSKLHVYSMNYFGKDLVQKFKNQEPIPFGNRDSSSILLAMYHLPFFHNKN